MSKKKKRYTLRNFFNDLHLWMGVGSGLVLFIVCLSGTVYTFRHEVERALEPEKYYVENTGEHNRLSPDNLVNLIEAETGGKVISLSIPEEPDETYLFNVKASPDEARGTGYYVNPYDGSIMGTQGGPVSEFFGTVMRLHRWLLITGDVGKTIVGTATIIFVFLIISGFVLWWPKKLKNWKQGFTIRVDASWKRINHDLHNTLGFYSAILLLTMALTGLCWSFGWYRDGLSTILGAKVFGGRGLAPVEGAVPETGEAELLSIEELINRTDQVLTYKGNYRITLPDKPVSAVVIYKNKAGFFASSASDKLQLNAFTGEILKMERFSDKAFNEKIVASIKPLHTGEIFGTFSKIIYFLACLIATALPVTGVVIWINKLRKQKRKKKNSTSGKIIARSEITELSI